MKYKSGSGFILTLSINSRINTHKFLFTLKFKYKFGSWFVLTFEYKLTIFILSLNSTFTKHEPVLKTIHTALCLIAKSPATDKLRSGQDQV